MAERDHAKSDAEKDAIATKIMALQHQRIQSASVTLCDRIQSSSSQAEDPDMSEETVDSPEDPGPGAQTPSQGAVFEAFHVLPHFHHSALPIFRCPYCICDPIA
ncbi:uncharacterized protein EI90DRAFT_3125081 [Cantharellus anzutake]|uniref:uncharacterized protein n=1 Tax=Cantharellus anzutake TaxID=1750568 RepID=UPI001908A2C4|nr:uncharacterized protein EI90DRAFT_3125081 [Cantharellus anzutake]KAF8329821.1 hypothetical protein EI90DRAFT_3125081 [Cantharellus anzutake]